MHPLVEQDHKPGKPEKLSEQDHKPGKPEKLSEPGLKLCFGGLDVSSR